MFALIKDLLIESENNAINKEEIQNKTKVLSNVIILNTTNYHIRAMYQNIGSGLELCIEFFNETNERKKR